MASVFGTVAQPKASVGTVALRQDQSPTRSPVPPQQLDAEQRIATAGETVPIVFGKKAYDASSSADVGGTWVAPAMIRQSCQYEFDNPAYNDGTYHTAAGQFVYGSVFAVSQGQLVGTPAVGEAYIGDQNLQALNTGAGVQILKDYKDVAYMSVNPTYCPIPLAHVGCGPNHLSWLAGRVTSNPVDVKLRNPTNVLYMPFGSWFLVKTTGTLANTQIAIDEKQIDAVTGAVINAGTITVNLYPTVNNFLAASYGSYNWQAITIGPPARSGSYILRYTLNSINYQVNPAQPADTNEVSDILVAGWQSTSGSSTPPTVDCRAYADTTILAIEGNVYDAELKQKQACFYFDEGVSVDLYSQGLNLAGGYDVGASNQFCDLVGYLFKVFAKLQPTTAATIGSQFDVSNAESIASFCSNYGLLCNGVVSQNVNLIEYASQAARLFLLSLVSNGGQYQLRPLLPIASSGLIIDTALTPQVAFTVNQILPGSLKKSFIPADERKPFFAAMLWRETSPLVVSKQRSTQVSYAGTALDAPVEQFDMTELCASQNHAVVVATYELARRRWSTHNISFSTALVTNGLAPTDLISVETYRDNSKGEQYTFTEWYQVTSIQHNSDGSTNISASHFPVDQNNQSLIVLDMLNASFDVI